MQIKRAGFIIKSLILGLFTCLFILSCNKIPVGPGKEPAAVLSIADLRALYKGTAIQLGAFSISGVVISDAASKNISNGSVIIQSGGHGISVYFGGTISYKVGDSVLLDVTGDSLLSYRGSLEIKKPFGAVAPAPVATGIVVTPMKKTISELNVALGTALGSPDNIEYTLVEIESATATPAGSFGGNKTLTDVSGNMTLYTSSFATFSGTALPTTCQNWVGYSNTYNTTPEFQIRNTSDFTPGAGCGTPPPPSGTRITIAQLRAMYAGADLKIGDYQIGGVVISDAASKNISTGNVILQEGTAGIAIYFGGTITYNVGDSIIIGISGDSLLNYKGSLEVKKSAGSIVPAPVATGKTIVPVTKTISEVNTTLGLPLNSPDNFEYTLVTINNATVTPAGLFGGNKTLTDATGTTTLHTATTASFAGITMPVLCQNWTVYANNFNSTKEVQIRNTSDYTPGSSCGPPPPTPGEAIDLGTTSPFMLDFNNVGTVLPDGVTTKISASATTAGTDDPFINTATVWNSTGKGFKNFASATGLTSTSDATAQAASPNRALGVRQTSSAGYDPGAAFVFKIANTTGKTNFKMDFLLQSLDISANVTRTTTWVVDYGFGDAPATFSPVAATGTVTTGNMVFSSNGISVDFGGALDNKNEKIWIRVVAITASTGTGSRASTGIDDVKFSWN